MDFIDYFLQNHDKTLYVLAGLSLALELTVLGLSGPLLFFAIACSITGICVSLGILNSWELEVLSVGLLSMLCAIALWKPLKNFQGTEKIRDDSSDMIGKIVKVNEEITQNSGSIRYSGINWQAKIDASTTSNTLNKGSKVEISAVEGTTMIVKTLD